MRIPVPQTCCQAWLCAGRFRLLPRWLPHPDLAAAPPRVTEGHCRFLSERARLDRLPFVQEASESRLEEEMNGMNSECHIYFLIA